MGQSSTKESGGGKKKGPVGAAMPPPALTRAQEFARCFRFACFFHGSKAIEDVLVKGLRISQANSKLGANDPRGSAPSEGAPIYLGLYYDTSMAYGGNVASEIARVFLDIERAARRLPPPTEFSPGDGRIFIDRDNGGAVLTMADIAATAIFRGTLTQLATVPEHRARLAECLRCIRTYSASFRLDTDDVLKDLLLQCVDELLLMDLVELESTSGKRLFPQQ